MNNYDMNINNSNLCEKFSTDPSLFSHASSEFTFARRFVRLSFTDGINCKWAISVFGREV
jgi:hypothetical protein